MADERPVQEWYPRARVTLLVRFEEFAKAISSKPPTVRQTLRKGSSNTKELEYVPDPDAPPGTTRYMLQPKGGSKIAAASEDKLTHQLWGVIPLSANHTRNGLDKADTLTLEMTFLDVPFDPRCIRSCAVDYYLGTITADEAAVEASAGVPTMIPDSTVDERGNVRSNRRMRGWVDSWEVSFSDTGTPTVKLECRDNRSILIDQQSPPQLHLDPKLPLDKAIAAYLSEFPQFAGLSVEWRGDGEAPKLSNIVTAKGQGKGGKTGSEKSSVMDYLTDMAGSAGCVLLMQETTIVVSKPRTVLKSGATRPDDPHVGAVRSINGMPLPNRTFVWGHNVKTMKFGRKLNAAAPSNIEVRCFPGNTWVEAVDVQRCYRREYSGQIARVFVGRAGAMLTGTPNHPVLTLRGWVALSSLNDGDHLVCGKFRERGCLGDPHVQAIPTKIGDLFVSLQDSSNPKRMSIGEMDFHGDGKDSEIDVVSSDSLLWNRIQSSRLKHTEQHCFKAAGELASKLSCTRTSRLRPIDFFSGSGSSSCGGVTRGRECSLGFNVGALKAKVLSLLMCTNGYAHPNEAIPEPGSLLPSFSVQLEDGRSLDVSLCTVNEVRNEWFSGHVYNLQTESGWYIANGIIAHNCYIPGQKRTISVRFPDLTTQAAPGGAADKKIVVWRIQGVTNKDDLKVVAQSVYEQSGRQELNVDVTTTVLASFGGDNYDPDILDMVPGDSFDAYIMREKDGHTSVGEIEDGAMSSRMKLVQMLTDMGHDMDMAMAYADSYTAGGFQTTFRTRALKTDWSIGEGVSISLTGSNYVEVRLDKEIT